MDRSPRSRRGQRLDRSAAVALVAAILGLAWAAQVAPAVEFGDRERARIAQMSPLPPLPADPTNAYADDPRAAELGQRFFFDARLSRNGRVACATCHIPEQAFTDGKSVAVGIGHTHRNTPSLINVAYQRWFFWDGRADTPWSQALQPLEHELEMGGNRVAIARLVHADSKLRAAYESVFGALPDLAETARFPDAAKPAGEGVAADVSGAWERMAQADRDAIDRVFANVGKALAAYERRLVGGTSPFDRFADGLATGDAAKIAALDAAAQRGLKLFIGEANCRLCHSGPELSDGEFHDLGLAPLGGGERLDSGRHGAVERVLADRFNALSSFSDAREGEAATKLRHLAKSSDLWGQFRTPSLRNVALTAPLMHEGQLADLDAVLRFYSAREGAAPLGHHQEKVLQPLELTPAELADLRAFLESLTDAPLDPDLLRPPP